MAIDTTIISVAIPKISTQFHTLDDVGWYGSAHLITMTALHLVEGVLYKLFNVKRVYLISMLIFEGIPHSFCPEILKPRRRVDRDHCLKGAVIDLALVVGPCKRN